MTTLIADLRYACRALAGRPGFAAVAILTLALGIGANTAIFSILDAVLLRPLPYSDPDRLAMVWERNFPRNRMTNVVAPANFLNWLDEQQAFEQMSAFTYTIPVTLTGAGDPEEVPTQFVSPNFFDVLGIQPIVGRGFRAEDGIRGSDNVVVISHRLWQRRFGGDPSIIGRSVTLSAVLKTVVGVAPPGFHLSDPTVDTWCPLAFSAESKARPRGRSISVVARLKKGTDVTAARADMERVANRMRDRFPEFNDGWGAHVVSLRDQLVGSVRLALLVIVGAVGFVLLIACANVANLLLARTVGRQRELAIRAALGASRGRIVAQLLSESVVLGVAGGLLGVLLAWAGLHALSGIPAGSMPLPRLQEIGLDGRVLAFTTVVSILTAMLFGLAPALMASHAPIEAALRQGGRTGTEGPRTRRIRNALVVVEVALALMLLVGAGLLIRSVRGLLSVDPGFNTQGVLTMKVTVPASKYSEARRVQFFRDASDRLARLPGVTAAGTVTYLPLDGLGSATSFTVVGDPPLQPGLQPVTDVRVISRDYLRAMGIPLLRGRLFSDEDGAEGRRLVVISAALARQHFADRDPIGQRLAISWDPPGAQEEIVGVVGDVRYAALNGDVRPMIYWPHPRSSNYNGMGIVLRTTGRPQALAPSATAAIRELDPELPVTGIRTLEEIVGNSILQSRLTMSVLTVFAGVALVLAAIGLYGVLAYAVSQRVPEIGVRMALGASGADVLRLVLGQSLALTAAGLVLGFAGALGLSRFVGGLLFNVRPTDPATYATIALVLLAVSALAAWVPVRRAMRVDPVSALRAE